MGLLDGDLQKSLYAGFKGKLLRGSLRKEVTPESGALDGLGDPIEVAPTYLPIEGFVENYDAAFAGRAGIPITDLKLCFFSQTLGGVEPGIDDKAYLDNQFGRQWYQIRDIKTDPASVLYECQSFEIAAPIDPDPAP